MSHPSLRPSRLHHHAFVSRDQEATRRFYEEVVGLPLIATWCEENELGAYCHAFYGLAGDHTPNDALRADEDAA